MAIIALHAKMRSGKDSFAQIVTKLYPRHFERIAFADKLKESICAIFKISLQDLELLKNDPDSVVMCGNKDTIKSVMPMRELLQRFGTEGHRDIFGTNFWVDQALSDLPLITDKRKVYVITDCRFENEIRRVKELGGIVINIKRMEQVSGDITNHASEENFSYMCDYKIENNGTLEDLMSQVQILIKKLHMSGKINLEEEW